MIDLLHLRIPLKSEAVTLASDGSRFCDLNRFSKSDGIILRSQTTYESGSLLKLYEGHSFESLPSSYTGVACCLRSVGHVSYPEPYLEVKFSPAKILQGHNVFGPDSIKLGFVEVLAVITSSWPDLASCLDVIHSDVLALDITYSAYFDSPTMVHQAKRSLETAGSGHSNRGKRVYDTTVYFSQGSSYSVKKVYEKGPEVENQISELKKLLKREPENIQLKNTLSAHKSVLSYSSHLLRFEATVKRRMLEKYGISSRVYDLIKNEKTTPGIYEFLWSKSFEPVMKSLEGLTMSSLDETEICRRIDNQFTTYSDSGRVNYRKARAVRSFFFEVQSRGLQAVQASMAPRTYYDNLKALKSIGLSDAAIRSLNSDTKNIIPLVRIINVDFKKQYPDNYIEPTLKLASGMEKFI